MHDFDDHLSGVIARQWMDLDMDLRVFDSKTELGKAAADDGAKLIRFAIANGGQATIVLATGASQFEMLDALVRAEGIDWSRVTAFHLDEYAGLPATHAASFRRYLQDRFLSHLPGLGAFMPVNGDAFDLASETARLNGLLRGRRIVVCFAGIGENGHLAFNDPPADFDTRDPYILVTLDEACRRQQQGEGWFPTLADVPQRAISMSVRQMLVAETLILSVSDARKASALKAAVEGPLTPACPASIVRLHKDCRIFADTAAVASLSVRP
jgi:glucosamine-6-phosphate deaminase